MNSVEILNLFSESYIESRNKFLSAAKKRHLAIDHYISPFKGINQEELAIDVVYEGEVNASKLLIILSGVHGVEGFTGSAIQTGLLSSTLNLPHDIAILYIHAVNPYGFSYLRRVNEDNVDLNRNFINFAENLPENKEYSKIHNALLPPIYPFEQDEQLNHYQVIHGEKSLEYGTYPLDKMINTLRADHWAYRYKQFDTVQGNEIRKNLKDTFYPDDPEWKNQIWKQAHKATLQALSGLKNNDA